MITLTRLSGSVFALNSDLIERVDRTPDTVITLVDGKKYVVREDLTHVVAAVRAYRGGIIAESGRLTAHDLAVTQTGRDTSESGVAALHRHLTAVPGGGPAGGVVDTATGGSADGPTPCHHRAADGVADGPGRGDH